ncbi:cytochrome P450 6a8-like [Haematobia irritans]|uniref:cytochrome P450 6a8-like n=1 Tax=Haematobia irritans TaxID=7368 RepID=UPI003F4FEF12
MACICATVCLILAIPLIIIAIWIRRGRNYWKRRNVATEPVPELYKIKERKHVAFALQRVYKKLKAENKPYVGIYSPLSPAVVVADMGMMKQILISDFDSFPDRGLYANYNDDPLSRNLVRLQGDLWRRMRNKLTPTFTSGKMKQMFSTIIAIGQRFVQVMEQTSMEHNHLVEIRDLSARFTTDVIGSVAFGLDCNSLHDPRTEFRVKGDKAFYTINPLFEMLASQYPKFFQWLGYKVFTKELIDFYSRIVRENVDYREKNSVKRNDFLDLLIELKNNPTEDGELQLTLDDIIAQAFVFFIGGFETSSSTMTFALYELAKNPAIQEKARESVRNSLAMHEEEFTYESLNEMTYIRQVVQETLRKYPVAPTGRRTCRRSYTLPGPHGFTIEPGVSILIPVYAMHHDPLNFPQPEIFRPERFTTEERKQLHPMAYQPFGAGPRSCIAERFGMMQSMLGVALLLNNFKFSICEKTPDCLKFDPFNIRVFNPSECIYLNVERFEK